MIRHYDMTTGELIEELSESSPAEDPVLAESPAEARLMTVQEEISAEKKPSPCMPADMLTLDLGTYLDR